MYIYIYIIYIAPAWPCCLHGPHLSGCCCQMFPASRQEAKQMNEGHLASQNSRLYQKACYRISQMVWPEYPKCNRCSPCNLEQIKNLTWLNQQQYRPGTLCLQRVCLATWSPHFNKGASLDLSKTSSSNSTRTSLTSISGEARPIRQKVNAEFLRCKTTKHAMPGYSDTEFSESSTSICPFAW